MTNTIQIDNKKPLISEEVRNITGKLNDLLNSVSGKKLTVSGLSVGSPIGWSLDVTLNDNLFSKKNVNLNLTKDSKLAEQIQIAQIQIADKGDSRLVIEYYPKRQILSIWTDDLVSYFTRKTSHGIEDFDYTRGSELNDIFIKYGKKFLSRLQKLKKHFK